MRRAYTVLFATLIGLSVTLSSAQSPKNNVFFIVDFSGSMIEKSGVERKIDAAKKAFRETMEELDPSTQVGLMVFGQTRPGKHCDDITVLSRLGERTPRQLARSIDGLEAQGWTPIADSLLKARPIFANLNGDNNSVVLITDGREECDGDVCSAAQQLKDLGVGVKIHIVGLGHSDADRKSVECAATRTGGKYVSASDAKTLKEAIEVVTAPPSPPSQHEPEVAQSTPPPPLPPPPVLGCTVKELPKDMREWIRAGAIRIEVKDAEIEPNNVLRIPITIQNCSGAGFGLAIQAGDTKLISCEAEFRDAPGLRLYKGGPSPKLEEQGQLLQWFVSDEQKSGALVFGKFNNAFGADCKRQTGGTVSVIIGLIISDEKKVQTVEDNVANIPLK